MLKRLVKLKLFFLLLIFGCIFLFIYSYKKNEVNEVCTDIEFIKHQFPNIEDIEEVRYYYNVKSDEREIGLQNIEFCGFIKIGKNFYEKIVRDYNWKETKKLYPKRYLWRGILRNTISYIIMTFLMMESINLIHGEEISI